MLLAQKPAGAAGYTMLGGFGFPERVAVINHSLTILTTVNNIDHDYCHSIVKPYCHLLYGTIYYPIQQHDVTLSNDKPNRTLINPRH